RHDQSQKHRTARTKACCRNRGRLAACRLRGLVQRSVFVAGKVVPSALPRGIECRPESKYGTLLVVQMPMDGHRFTPLPALNGAHVALQVGSDSLPGVETILVLGSRRCVEVAGPGIHDSCSSLLFWRAGSVSATVGVCNATPRNGK